MYIKINTLKKLFLIMVCIFFASFNYFTYAENIDSDSNSCDKNIDSDCDGLTNTEENLYGTDINKNDTDNDSYSDGIEVQSGYDPLKPAPGDKIETGIKTSDASSKSTSSVSNSSTLTDEYLQNLSAFVSSKEGQNVSVTDLRNFADEQIAKNMGDSITWDTLPSVDETQLNILKQNYSSLSDADRKKREAEDSARYLNQVLYLMANNLPVQILTKDDFTAFQEDFLSKVADVGNSKENISYFSDLGNRLEAFSNQVSSVQVPETMVDLHVKFLRLIKGVLTLKDYSLSSNDPMGKLVIANKATAYLDLFADFFKNDFQSYYKEISAN